MTNKEINEMLYPRIEEDTPEYNTISITIREETEPFTQQYLTIIEEDI